MRLSLLLLCSVPVLTLSFACDIVFSSLRWRCTTRQNQQFDLQHQVSTAEGNINSHHNLTQSSSTHTSARDKLDTLVSKKNTDDTSIDVPRHIAFICDGNSRWAELNSLPTSIGHARGADRVIKLISSLRPRQSETNQSDSSIYFRRVQYCTLFAFSTENWSRPKSEIDTIFKLIERVAIQYQQHDAIKNGQIQIQILGDLDDNRIPSGMRNALNKLQFDSREACSHRQSNNDADENNILIVCLAINYGGRADLLQATAKLAQAIAAGEVVPPGTTIDEAEITKRLYTANLPDPDLIIRTGGENRLSNFLLWNAAYAELCFSDVLWPDFDEVALEEAITWYGKRNRRFGGRED
ncbi:hypothetical protein ACHAWO_010768 [Cyclotella atomus]|uniref:Alkyl transferase n=1 Tax=Cyclotella atomus TaxID=382360 RepID=A0ABD3NKS5_9STRA